MTPCREPLCDQQADFDEETFEGYCEECFAEVFGDPEEGWE